MTGPQHRPNMEEIWRRYDSVEARLSAPLSERMLDLAALRPGMNVIDLATGRGEPAIRAAHRVGPSGRILAVEPSAPMLRIAQERADQEGLANLDWRVSRADELDDVGENRFHVATVRWGLMYMTAPTDALAAIRRVLLPGGVLVAALWAEPERVPYHVLTRRLLERYREIPADDHLAPGMFAYANVDRIARDLTHAGFVLEYTEEMDVPLFEAQTGAEVLDWVIALGSGLSLLLNDLSAGARQAWEQDFLREVECHRTGDWIRIGGVTRIVRARVT